MFCCSNLRPRRSHLLVESCFLPFLTFLNKNSKVAKSGETILINHYNTIVTTVIPLSSTLSSHIHFYQPLFVYIIYYPHTFTHIPMHSKISIYVSHYSFAFNYILQYSTLFLCIQRYPLVFHIILLHSTISPGVQHYSFLFKVILPHSMLPRVTP